MPDLRAAMHRRNSSAGTEEYDLVTTCTIEDTCSSTCGSSVGGSQRRWVSEAVGACTHLHDRPTFRHSPCTISFAAHSRRLRGTQREQCGHT